MKQTNHDLLQGSLGSIGDQTITIQDKPIVWDFKTLIYSDFKKFISAVGKLIVTAILLFMVYHYLGWWPIISFAVFFAWSYKWLIVKIAEKFMSFVTLAAIELDESGVDVFKVVQISMPRFKEAYIVDDNNQKAALNAPFFSVLGLTYIVDKVILDFVAEGEPDANSFDIIRIHNTHNNVKFVKDYVKEFLALRKDYYEAMNELFALKSKMDLMVEARTNEKLEAFLKMIDNVYNAEFNALNADQQKQHNVEEIQRLIQLGVNVLEQEDKELVSNFTKPVYKDSGGRLAHE